MLYSITAVNTQGIDGSAQLSNGKVIATNHPLNDLPGFNPEELIALAWSTCLNATIKTILESKGIQQESNVSVTVDLLKETDQAGYYFKVTGVASIRALPLEQAQELIHHAHARCPVSKLISQASSVSLHVKDWQEMP